MGEKFKTRVGAGGGEEEISGRPRGRITPEPVVRETVTLQDVCNPASQRASAQTPVLRAKGILPTGPGHPFSAPPGVHSSYSWLAPGKTSQL